jgi:hypothetical protein
VFNFFIELNNFFIFVRRSLASVIRRCSTSNSAINFLTPQCPKRGDYGVYSLVTTASLIYFFHSEAVMLDSCFRNYYENLI